MKNILLVIVISSLFQSSISFASEITKYGDGYMEMIGEYPVLHLKGGEWEMGKQYGYLAGDRILSNINNLKEMGKGQLEQIGKIPDVVFKSLRRIIGWIFWLTYPKNVKEHIKGIVHGASENGVNLNRYDVAFVNAVIDIVGIAGASDGYLPGNEKATFENNKLLQVLGLSRWGQQCDSMAVWGSRTQGGKTFQTRNTDLTTGIGIEKYPVIVIYKPDGKIPFINAGFAGMVGVFSGMNAYGVGVGQVWAASKDVKLATPWNIVMRKFLSEETTAKAVVEKMRKRGTTTYGNNFVIADAGNVADPSDTGFAVEMTSKNFASFKANDQRELLVKYENVPYAYPIPEAVYRGDVSFDVAIRSRQFSGNGPDGNARESGSYKERYKGQYDLIKKFEDEGVKIGKEEAELISRETAMKNSSLQTAVYANTDRDMWVSYAKVNEDGSVTQANQREYVNIPFYSYLAALRSDQGSVTIENWFTETKELTLKHYTHQKLDGEMKILINAHEKVKPYVHANAGDVVELYDDQNRLVDRLQL